MLCVCFLNPNCFSIFQSLHFPITGRFLIYSDTKYSNKCLLDLEDREYCSQSTQPVKLILRSWAIFPSTNRKNGYYRINVTDHTHNLNPTTKLT